MKIMLLGAPGVGKGTQAEFLRQALLVPKISTGDMLRAAIAADAPLGREAKAIMDSGKLVPDAIMIQLVKERLQQADCQHGFLLDGFPRTVTQAEALTAAGVELDYVIEIQVDEEGIVRRMDGRRVHPGSGRTYHLAFHPPKVADCDDETGEPLIQREDDKEATVRHRLRVYQQQTFPLVQYYRQQAQSGKPSAPHYITIDGMQEVASVRAEIFKALHLDTH